MSQFAAVLSTVFSGEVMLAIAIGTLAGMVIGAMPGLSATMGVALLTPLTYTLSPSAAISMLAAVYTSAIYGGSITACLLHTPGTPASAATAADGYALTKQGQGMKAIGISTVCSMIGGTISAIALLLISEPLSRISLMFTPAEYMLLGLFGLTIIGSLSGDNLLKGLIAGAVGLVIACIGLDGMSGVPRYVFGITRLESGISMVPAMIGMFSISQAMIIAEDLFKGKSLIVDDPTSTLKGRVLPSAKEMKRITPTVIKSTIIGIFVGILPAAGGDIGSWVGYNNAKKSSKHPEEFGHGSIEGIAASEAANNAVTGGALIPLLTLGIPGSGTAAIMLGSLMIHGMQPGPELFTKQAVQTYTIIVAFMLANILMGILGLLISKYVARVALVPMSILCPVIVALSTIGSYAINNSIFDVYVMAFFGLLGYLFRKANIGSAPVILGVILSSMVEKNYRRMLILSRGAVLPYIFSHPIAIVLIVMILLGVFSPFLVKKINSKIVIKEPAGDAPEIDIDAGEE